MSWTRFAACSGRTDLFYAAAPWAETLAVAICAGCGVRERCVVETALDEALLADSELFGVRGGRSAAQRRASRLRLERPVDVDVTAVPVVVELSGRRAWPHSERLGAELEAWIS
jgi:hypothetical protein